MYRDVTFLRVIANIGEIMNGEGAMMAERLLGGLVLEPHAAMVGTARHRFRSALEALGPACSVDDCVLLLSELVTNAMVHGRAGGPVRVRWYRAENALRVEVHGARGVPGPAGEAPGPERVRIGRPGPYDEGGRGLVLLGVLAGEWSAGFSPYGGVVVAFVIHGAWTARPGVPGAGGQLR